MSQHITQQVAKISGDSEHDLQFQIVPEVDIPIINQNQQKINSFEMDDNVMYIRFQNFEEAHLVHQAKQLLIQLITSQEKGNSYLICNAESHKMYDLVVKLYLANGIELERSDNILREKNTGLEVVIIQDKQLGFDSAPTNIRGEATKLSALGWTPLMSVADILGELV